MRSFLKTIVSVGFFVVVLLAFVSYFGGRKDSGSTSTLQVPLEGTAADTTPAYHDSNEILFPYDLSKNPYKWKGRSGILDTVDLPIIMGNGARAGNVGYPGGSLKFERMIDEHTATYSVSVAEGSVITEGEIAVILPNSDPPDSGRPWRVFVEGPMAGTNALGAQLTVVTVRFEGYYSPPPQPIKVSSEAEPVPMENSKPSAAQADVPPETEPVPVPPPVGNASSVAQPTTITEIDQQATGLWNQKRYSDAFHLFNQACIGGNANSCYYLGLMYDFGQGLPQDSSRAAALYSKSCNSGNSVACYHLGMLRDYRAGAPICNSAALIPNATKGCESGNAMSCTMLGYSYSYGCGVPRNTARGRQFLSNGCSLGYARACDGIQ